MSRTLSILVASLSLAMLVPGNGRAIEPAKMIELWPGGAPDEKTAVGEEHDTTKPGDRPVAGKRVVRIGNVSKPAISIYQPPSGKGNGTAIIVCPGGGYKILAVDLEGSEVCDWLNSIGVTGVLLKYRVPKREGDEAHKLPLQDAQRALGIVRHQAKEWGLDPKRIGIMGFSAGGHLAASLSNNYQQRSYQTIDEADAVSCRPDFTLLLYPGSLVLPKEDYKLAPDIKITENTPPTFIATAADDPIPAEHSLYYTLALRKSKVPVELHLYSAGGHGYGMRPVATAPVTSWPHRAEAWLSIRGLLMRN
jgi:acetyl esterase/lipase